MKLISIQDAALLIGASRSDVTEWTRRSEDPLPSITIGRTGRVVRVLESEIDTWLARQASKAGDLQ